MLHIVLKYIADCVIFQCVSYFRFHSINVTVAMERGLRLIGVILLLAIVQTFGKGDFEDFNHAEHGISQKRISQYYTEVKVQGADKQPQKCSERVFQSRKAAQADGKKLSLGVEPTVGLGAALLIFLGVGVFAAGIAQAFQMVSYGILNVWFTVELQ